MPAYNFMEQWVPKILDGSKAQTIRRKRKRPTVAGDELSLYVGQRTKSCRLIGRAPCVQVTPIMIYPLFYLIVLDGKAYGYKNAKTKLIAFNDGFESTIEFFEFFERYKKIMLKDFEIIEWDPTSAEWMMERDEWRMR